MRTTALVVLAAGTLLVAGCAEPEVTATNGGTVAPSGAVTSSATGTGTTSGSTTGSPSTTTGKPTAGTTASASPSTLPQNYVTVDKTITDTGLGHKILISRILRNLPWPDGYRASSEAYELVALELTLTPGTTYTAPLRVQDLSVTDTGSQYPNRPDSLDNALLTAAKLPLLPAQVETGKSAKGWVVFRIDPKGAAKMTLTFTRPKSEVTDTGQVFASRVFATTIVG